MRAACEGRVDAALAKLLGRIAPGSVVVEKVNEGRRCAGVLLLRRGLRVALEGSSDPGDAERGARRRLEEGLCDLAVAVWHDIRDLPRGLADEELERVLEESKLRIKIFVPGEKVEDVTRTLPDYLRGKGGQTPVLLEEAWLGVDVPLLVRCVDLAIEHMLAEEMVKETEDRIKEFVNSFVLRLKDVDRRLEVCESLYDVFYKLYGLSVGECEKIGDLIYGKAALTLLLSAVFYESLRTRYGLESLKSRARRGSHLDALREALGEMLGANYGLIFGVAREVAEKLPPETEPRIGELVDLAARIAGNRVMLRRDFAGRVYHTIVGDWAVRKGFATYFTETPAAYLLTRLALATPNPSWKSFAELDSFRVADLACGSGTLLSAAYDALLYLYTRDRLSAGLEAGTEEFHRVALEKVLWGLDALRFAVHIAATVLVLHEPGVTVRNTNLYTVPLGVDPRRGYAVLGSLDVARGGLFNYSWQAVKVSTSGEELTTVRLPRGFDLIVMNPPFTRATGRGGEEGAGLFGFVADTSAREKLVNAYLEFKDRVKSRMVEVAKRSGLLARLSSVLSEEELRPFLEIGQAGEGLLFLYVAGERVAEGGRIAFVLPKSLLSGASWFLARAYLVTGFHVEYVVVSYDAERGYNFSESTQLSECLVVARRVKEPGDDDRTLFAILLRKPRNALEGVWLAHEVVEEYSRSGGAGTALRDHRAGSYVRAGESRGVLYSVPRRLLLEHLDNWGKLVAFLDPQLSAYALSALGGRIELGREVIEVPLRRLGSMVVLGMDSPLFHENFRRVDRAPGTLPCLYGGGEEVRSRMEVEPNSGVVPKTERGAELFGRHASQLLVPDRIWLETAHVIALYTTEPAVSNVFYTVRLRSGSDPRKLKALCAWLNSTWGVLSVLACRQETRGAWIRLKKSHWRLLPVPDVESLPEERLGELAGVFEKFKRVELRRLPDQYSGQQRERLELDLGVLRALKPDLDEGEARKWLADLYKAMGEALEKWIG